MSIVSDGTQLNPIGVVMKMLRSALAVVILVGSLAVAGSVEAATTTLPIRCTGSDSTSAGSLALVGGAIDASLTVNHDAPEALAPGDSANVNFSFVTNITPTLIDKAVVLLGVTEVKVSNLSFSVSANGGGVSESLNAGPFSETIPVAAGTGLSLSKGPFSIPVNNVGVGVVSYRFAPVNMTVGLGGISVNVTCAAVGSNVVTKTVVRDPDAPIVQNATVNAKPGESVTVDVSEFVTENKTPLIPDSYRVVEGPGVLNGTTLNLTAPTEPGTYSTTFEVCAEPKPESGDPGRNENAAVKFGAIEQNERPVAFSLKVGGVETPLIWTAYAHTPPFVPASLGSQSKTNMDDWFEYLLLTNFKAPTAQQIQDALTFAGLENVTTGTYPNFNIEFVGNDGSTDLPDVEIGKWFTVLPYEFFEGIQSAVSNLGNNGGGSNDPLLTDDQIWNLILQGKTDEAGAALQARLLAGVSEVAPQILEWLVNSFAQPPLFAVTNGEPPTPAQPLCAQGQVDVAVSASGGGSVQTPNDVSGVAQPGGAPAAGVAEQGGVGIAFTG